MGRKSVAIVPQLPASLSLSRFHGEATDKPLYAVATWATSKGARKRQVAIETHSRRLLEMQRIGATTDKNRSWFIGNHVLQDGSMLVFSPLDPLFVLLNAVFDERTKYSSTYDLLSQSQNVWWLQLGSAVTQEKIEQICDVQFTGGDEALDNLYVRFNEVKAITWLSNKVRRVAKVLSQQAASSSGAFDTKFVLPGQTTTATTATISSGELDPHYLKEAIDLVADYVPSSLTALVYKELGISKTQPVSAKTPGTAVANVDSAGVDSIRRFDRRHSQEGATPNKRAPASSANASAKKSKLANVDRTGMKSLSSFFGKK
ncbi:hypothetical protein Poli38472_005773 [Pythium oligandrum]|uniref:Ribonuclease H2 subunit B n=1 Tax=Pythium oligandrum TaxID=41045 RepID=A0A8K1CRP1_PYTOL|nr:hypothetical protein Poli38472_005773 [Pythium oligandrum]|eukprot:TMW68305.1 hypothetical protein Poli38472_005773 [Pythium oligandrum]